MLPDRVSNPGPLTYESGALPITRKVLLKRVKLSVPTPPYKPALYTIANSSTCTPITGTCNILLCAM